MSSPFSAIIPTRASSMRPLSSFGRFVDALIQTFEDCRGGLSDETVNAGEAATERFFIELYEREDARFEEMMKMQESHLSERARAELKREIDSLIRKVVIPGYVRMSMRFTRRERNDFYLTEERFHALERIGFGVAGVLAGTFVIVAPFIPIWEKEWILPFMIGGLLFPNIRRYLANRKYERDLNQLVAGADRQFSRIDVAYLTSGETSEELQELEKYADHPEQAELDAKIAKLSAKREKEN